MIKPIKTGLIIAFLCINIVAIAKNKDSLSVNNIVIVENKGQWEENFLYKIKLKEGVAFIEEEGITFAILDHNQLSDFYYNKIHPLDIKPISGKIDAVSFKLKFVNYNNNITIETGHKNDFYYNYYLKNNPEKWKSKVSTFHELKYKNVYEGIDVVIKEHNGYFKCDYEIDSGANPDDIVLEFEGAKSIYIYKKNLYINTAITTIVQLAPSAYQIDEKGDTVTIACKYEIINNRVQLKLDKYDKSLKLIIDPVLIFSSYSGSTADNWGYTATYDKKGNLYAGGISFDIGYPVANAYQVNYAGGSCDISISKFNSTGQNLLYSTYLGGSSVEIPNSLIVNDNNELYLLATTGSNDFPTTANAFDNTFHGGTSAIVTRSLLFSNGSDIAIVKFNESGENLLAATYLGGNKNDGLNLSTSLQYNYGDDARGEINIDKQNNICVVTSTFSDDFPTTAGAFQPTKSGLQDACIVKMNSSLSNIIWASFLGGSGSDAGYSIEFLSDNSLYVCGGTNSNNFPIFTNAFQQHRDSSNNKADGFITRISEYGNAILNSSYFGTKEYDQSFFVKCDNNDYPYLTGQTEDTTHFYINNAQWFNVRGKQFISKFSKDLSQLEWSTAFGSGRAKPDISLTAFMIDKCENIYLSGWGSLSTNGFGGTSGLPVTSDAFQLTTDNNDYYFLCLHKNASSLVYATYFGDPVAGEHVDGGTSRFDRKGVIYQAVCGGCGGYDNFPTTPNAFSSTNGSSNCNLAVIKMDFLLPLAIADFEIPDAICNIPATITPQNASNSVNNNTTTFFWNFGDGYYSTDFNPVHTYTQSGIFYITLIITDLSSCNLSDTITKAIYIFNNKSDTLETKTICNNSIIQIGIPSFNILSASYSWSPSTGLDNPNISNPITNTSESTRYMLIISIENCTDTLFQQVNVTFFDVIMPNDTTICQGNSLIINPQYYTLEENPTFYWTTAINPITVINQDITNPVIFVNPLETTKYYLKALSYNCEINKEITVFVSSITAKAQPFSRCFGDTLLIYPNISCIHCGELSYEWQAHQSIISSNLNSHSIFVAPSVATKYTVTVSNNFGCSVICSIVVKVQNESFNVTLQLNSDDDTIYQSQSTWIHATDYGHLYTYHWMQGDGTMINSNTYDILVSPNSSTLYILTVTDSIGCSKTDSILIIVKELNCKEPYIYIPNAFTPNKDGKNDILYVESSIVTKIKFKIYNQWGQLIFETEDFNAGWDGTYKNREAPEGVYDYWVEAICKDGNYFYKKGNVTLMR